MEITQEMSELLELAKINLVRDGRLEMVAIIHRGSQHAIFPMEKVGSKGMAQEILRDMILELKPDRVVVISEVYTKMQKADEPMPVGSLAGDKDAREAIMILGWELGEAVMIQQPFTKVHEAVEFIGMPEPPVAIPETKFFPSSEAFSGCRGNA